MTAKLFASLGLVALLGSSARADAPPAADPAPAPAATKPGPHLHSWGNLLVALKGGALFSQPFSNLGPSYLVDVEVGYVLPVLARHLAITLDVGFTDPQLTGTQTDARLDASGGSYTWHLEQRELILGLTVYYRHPIGRVTPYIGIGPRLFLVDTRVNGLAGSAPIDISSEQSTKGGAAIPLGVGFTLGPGHLFVEAAVILGNIDHSTTGNVAVGTSSISVGAGYRLVL